MDSSDGEYSNVSSDEAPPRATPVPDGMHKRTRSSGRDLKTASGAYAWEDEYQRLWDIVKDDADGRSLELVVQNMIEARKKKIMRHATTPFQRGIIRLLVVVVDGLAAMLEKDLRPTRFLMTLLLLTDFIVEFFDQNPILQLGIVMMRNGVAHLVLEVLGLPQHHLDKVRQLKARQHNRFEPKGDPLLQNALEMARLLLMYNFGSANDRTSKEILVVFGALFTSDPGDIHRTMDSLVRDKIKVKVIGLAAQVAICQDLVAKTNGVLLAAAASDRFYGVIMNEAHFKELLMACVVPLPVAKDAQNTAVDAGKVPLIKMGFPTKLPPPPAPASGAVSASFPRLCACHPSQGLSEVVNAVVEVGLGTTGGPALAGYQCPQCYNRVCHLPTICPICGLMLILSTHLARLYHHLVPLGDYKEVPMAASYASKVCYGCLLRFPEGMGEGAKNGDGLGLDHLTSSRYRCRKCRHDFCIDCDVFVHEVLHNCPGCENATG